MASLLLSAVPDPPAPLDPDAAIDRGEPPREVDDRHYLEHVLDDAIDGLALDRIDQWQRGFEERAAQARALAARTSGLSATAREGNGNVEVTVGADGQITRLRLDEDIRRQPAETTARQVMDAIRAAQELLVRDFAQATADTVGLESATGRALMSSLNARLGRTDPPAGSDPAAGSGTILQ